VAIVPPTINIIGTERRGLRELRIGGRILPDSRRKHRPHDPGTTSDNNAATIVAAVATAVPSMTRPVFQPSRSPATA
jgi:hypothetical protein